MLRIKPSATFKAPVPVALPGGATETITVEFKHMTKKEMNDFIEAGRAGEDGKPRRSDCDTVMGVAVGWEGTDGAFNKENITEALENYHNLGNQIMSIWFDQLTQIKEKN